MQVPRLAVQEKGIMACRNGRELREMLPLWKGNGVGMPCRRPVERVRRKGRRRNGRESREMLPLWKGNGGGIPCRRPVEGVRRKGRRRNGR